MKRLAILMVLGAMLAPRLPADVAVTIGTRQAALVVEDTRFDPAVQLLSEAGVSVGAVSRAAPSGGGSLGVDLGFALAAVRQSGLVGGVIYRGLTTRSLLLAGRWRSGTGVGVELGGRAVFATYDLTNALFFFPEAYLAPLLSLPLSRDARVEWSLPFSWQFRVDLAYAFSVGVAARLALEFGAP